MKKFMQALLCAVVLIGGASLAGEFFRRGKELEQMTPSAPAEETVQAVAATTQKSTVPKTTAYRRICLKDVSMFFNDLNSINLVFSLRVDK